jgi:hypothetical protein
MDVSGRQRSVAIVLMLANVAVWAWFALFELPAY